MEVRAIRSEAAYRTMLAEVSAVVDLDPHPDSPEGERLEVLIHAGGNLRGRALPHRAARPDQRDPIPHGPDRHGCRRSGAVTRFKT